jgi:ubiquinone/menaquinone biosynthesis C-methylase UbiE
VSLTDGDWKEWGERDPYFGVVTFSQFRKEQLPQNRDAFFQTGERDVNLATSQANRFGNPIKRDRALDFACGVGRLLVPLARRFEQVVGLDISEGMMREARHNMQEFQCRNVSIFESDDNLSRADGTFDLVLSKIALQHIPVARGMRILRELLKRVGSGGAAVLDFSVHVERPIWKEFQYYKYRAARLVRGRDKVDPPMKMHSYELSDLISEFEHSGMKDISIDIAKHFGVVSVATISGRKD